MAYYKRDPGPFGTVLIVAYILSLVFILYEWLTGEIPGAAVIGVACLPLVFVLWYFAGMIATALVSLAMLLISYPLYLINAAVDFLKTHLRHRKDS